METSLFVEEDLLVLTPQTVDTYKGYPKSNWDMLLNRGQTAPCRPICTEFRACRTTIARVGKGRYYC